MKTNFFDYLDFALQFAPAGPEENEIRAKLARIGIRAGKTFDFKDLSPEHKAEVALGMKDGDAKIDQYLATGEKIINGWKVGSFFGDRAFFNGDWLQRAAGAKGGIYGNDAVEATYPMTKTLANGEPLDGSKHNYMLTFADRPVPAGQRVLVGDDVRRQDAAPDRKPDQSLPHQLADAAGYEEERGRIADALHPEGFARQGQGIQLASRAQRPHLPGDAPVLAEDRASLDLAARQRDVEAASHHGPTVVPFLLLRVALRAHRTSACCECVFSNAAMINKVRRGHLGNVNTSSQVNRTGTGLPSLVPGLNSHCLSATMAC